MSGALDLAGERAWRAAGAEVRRLRKDRGWSLTELKKEGHYSKGYLSKIENGKKPITPELARHFDKVFGTSSVLATLRAAQQDRTPVQDEPELPGIQRCPYPGLVAFGLEEARWFFGRTQVIADLVRRLDKHSNGCGPLAVVAPSGAGKSSLLAAGLIPALADEALPGSSDWPVVCATPGAHPLTTLVERIAAVTGAHPAAASAALTGDPDRLAAFLTEAAASGKRREPSSSARIVLIVDQFEEIFAECQQETERQAFITALGTAARSAAVLVVLGIRADFYGSCLAYPALLPALQAPVALGPMSAEQLREVITGPAAVEGLELEPDLVEVLLHDLGVIDDSGAEAGGAGPGALPLLAHALRVTCQHGESRALTVAGYQHTGGIRQALVNTADRAYNQLSPAERQVAQQLLLRLVNLRDQGKVTRRRLTRTQLTEALSPAHTVEKVLKVLRQARLVTFDTANPTRDGHTVEIAHEALLTAWPQLADWITADRDGLRTHQRLSEAAEEWQATNRDPSGLYRGTRLTIAREWATSPGHQDRLSALEDAFLSASINQKQREQHAQRRRTQLLAGLLVVALLAGGIAVQRSWEASKSDRRATATELMITSNSLVATQPDMAMLLAVEAYHLAETPRTRGALLSAQSQYFAGQLVGHTGPVRTVAFSPDGRMLATSSDDGTARLWDVASHHQITTLNGSGAINDAEFSPDGHTLATASADGPVRLWNVTDSTHPTPLGPPLTAHSGAVTAVAFSHNGRLLATTDTKGPTRLWDVASRRLIAPLTGQAGTNKVVFSHDDRILATTSTDGLAELWDVPSHHQITTLNGSGAINDAEFSPDGHTLATASADGPVRLWNVTDPTHPAPLGPPLPGSVTAVAFSPDGHTLVTGSTDGPVRLWNVATHRLVDTLGRHSDSITGVAFSPDGHTVATAGNDNITRLWDTGGLILISSSPVIDRFSHSNVAFSLNGLILATVGADGAARLWDVASRRLIATLPSPDNFFKVAFSLDNRTLATASTSHAVRLWNVTDPTHPAPLGPPLPGSVTAVAFSPDGHTLVTGSTDGPVRLWNVTDPTHPAPLVLQC